MTPVFRAGRVTVTVPASSANLGPGFDSLGLALDLRDTLIAEVYDGPPVVTVEGEGADDVPLDAEHLVHRAMAAAFASLEIQPPGIRLHCRNVIPHARGLGSSSAAIVGGITLAFGLLDREPDAHEALVLATRLEGHPDNVSPALLGGFTIAATDDEQNLVVAGLEPGQDIEAVVFVPPDGVETRTARGLLPTSVPHEDASGNAASAALLVAALTSRPDLLFAGTRDRLHQECRRPVMPDSLALVDALRADRVAAVVSGAGPSVLALLPKGPGSAGEADALVRRTPPGWRVLTPRLGVTGARVEQG